VALLLAGCLACGGEAPSDTRQDDARVEPRAYVGDVACGECHAAEHRRWRGSHHDLAMEVASAETVSGDFDDAEFTHQGVTSRFFRRDGRYFVRTEGRDGALADFEIAYTFGVDPLQQYLIAFPDGRLQALGIAWDTRPAADGGRRWFHLYPDERLVPGDPLHWTGWAQTWNHMCADCHSTAVRKRYDLAADRYATTWAVIDVSCEACHGPGAAHVAWARAGGEGDPPDDRLVPLGEPGAWRLAPGADTAHREPPRARRVEVETCAPCHARRALLQQDDASGRPLLDTHRPALLDAGLYHADGQILDEVYEYGSFLQSRMYAAGVTCSDCHDPHSLALLASGNALCTRCHRAERFDVAAHHHHAPDSAGARCVACHMPARTYMVVDVRRDHGLSVPRPDLAATLGTPSPCDACHADRGPGWAAERVATWRGGAPPRPDFARALDAGRRGSAGAAAALVRLADDPAAPAIVRATALGLLARNRGTDAGGAVRRALGDADPLVRLAAVEASETVEPRTRLGWVAPLLADPVRGVRIEAAKVLAAVPPSLWKAADRTALATALDEYRAAQNASADGPEAHLNLGLLHLRLGEVADARAEYETALRLAPFFVPAYVNLADLHRMAGREAEVERVLGAALAAAPGNADVLHALGLLRVRQKRPAEALDPLGRAAAGAPDRPRYAYVYAVALHTAGRTAAALDVLEKAQARSPGDRDLLIALATIHRDAGDGAAALRWARTLRDLVPGDPEAAALVAALESAAPGAR
jgi:predicted CXXCH cytochrome family protein